MKTVTLRCGACVRIDAARLDRVECEQPLRIGAGAEAAEAGEGGVGAAPVGRMRVAAFRIRLPDFDERVVDRIAGAVEDAPDDRDVLARHGFVGHPPAGADSGVVVAILRRAERVGEVGADGLRRRLAEKLVSRHRPVSIGVSARPRSTMSKT